MKDIKELRTKFIINNAINKTLLNNNELESIKSIFIDKTITKECSTYYTDLLITFNRKDIYLSVLYSNKFIIPYCIIMILFVFIQTIRLFDSLLLRDIIFAIISELLFVYSIHLSIKKYIEKFKNIIIGKMVDYIDPDFCEGFYIKERPIFNMFSNIITIKISITIFKDGKVFLRFFK